jgi:S1-C subfamily serine protease
MRTPLSVAAAVLVSSCLCVVARGENPPTPNTPLLQQINHETQALYESVRPGLVLVQLPPPRWVAQLMEQNNLLKKWGQQLDPTVREKLEEEFKANGQRPMETSIAPSSQPTTNPTNGGAGAASQQPSQPTGRLRVVQRPDGGIDLLAGPVDDKEMPQQQSGPRSLGLIVDDDGHVVVPYFVEKEAVGDQPLKVYLGGGRSVMATFVGSDQKTNLTVLKLQSDHPIGKPLRLDGKRPPEGSLVMVLLTNAESAEILIWTGGLRDSGVVIQPDGTIAGFSRGGQFLSGLQCRPLIEQIINTGTVKRAVLGVQLLQDDPQGPSGRPVVRILRVVPNSVAERAGLHAGDVVTSFAGAPVNDVPTFAAAIAQQNGPTELVVVRDGQPMKVVVELKQQ